MHVSDSIQIVLSNGFIYHRQQAIHPFNCLYLTLENGFGNSLVLSQRGPFMTIPPNWSIKSTLSIQPHLSNTKFYYKNKTWTTNIANSFIERFGILGFFKRYLPYVGCFQPKAFQQKIEARSQVWISIANFVIVENLRQYNTRSGTIQQLNLLQKAITNSKVQPL